MNYKHNKFSKFSDINAMKQQNHQLIVPIEQVRFMLGFVNNDFDILQEMCQIIFNFINLKL